jgi:hypothetical protein
MLNAVKNCFYVNLTQDGRFNSVHDGDKLDN